MIKKVAIIGFGRMGITHYSIINSHPNISVESVVETSSFVTDFLKKYTKVKTFNNYNILFKETKPDAIIVCTPPSHHYSILKLAAKNRIHVFCEKPLQHLKKMLKN